MRQEEVNFKNSKGHDLHGIIRIPESHEQSRFPAIIILHDFGENKDRDLIASISNHLSYFSFVTLRFDFSGHGISQGKFEDFTLSGQIDDVVSAVRFLREQEYVNKDMIGLIGHSFGGFVAMIVSHKYPVQSLVTIASRSSMDDFISSHFHPHQIDELSKKGNLTMHDFRTMGSDFLLDYKQFKEVDFSKIDCPHLIIHGTNDKRSPHNQAREIYAKVPEPKTLDIVEGANHEFSDEEHRKYLLDTLTNWFNRTLK